MADREMQPFYWTLWGFWGKGFLTVQEEQMDLSCAEGERFQLAVMLCEEAQSAVWEEKAQDSP